MSAFRVFKEINDRPRNQACTSCYLYLKIAKWKVKKVYRLIIGSGPAG